MRLKTLPGSTNLEGKKVLVRIDANVPIKRGRAVDGQNGRIAKAAVGLEWLRQRKAKIIVITHLGRPKGRKVAAYSTAPVAKRLKELMGGKIKHVRHLTGKMVEKQTKAMDSGDILVLENLRFDPGEKNNDDELAKELSGLADLYINDAFSNCHRKHASMVAITKFLPSYASPSLLHEVMVLSSIFEKSKHPFILLMGGLKAEGKIPVMKKMFDRADHIVVGGALATSFLVAQGIEVGKSVYDEESVSLARQMYRKKPDKFLLPVDVRVAKSLRSRTRSAIRPVEKLLERDYIVDVGPKTVREINRLLKKAKMIVWNGPFGLCEVECFCAGSETIARSIARRTGAAISVVGGGDTIPIADKLNLAHRYTLLSTGGGAMLEFLAGKKLPALEVLKK